MIRGTLIALICVGLFAFARGALAAPDLPLDIEIEQAAGEPTAGSALAVTFADGRGEADGGGDPASFGVLKSSESRRIVHAGGLGVADVVQAAVSAALQDAGFDVRLGGALALPRLVVTLQKMTAKGLTRCKVPVQLRLEFFAAGGAAPSWAETVAVKGTVTLSAGLEDLSAGYEDAMAAARLSMGELFGADVFQRAVGTGTEPTCRTTETESETETQPETETGAAPAAGSVRIDRITDATEKEASAQLTNLCLTHFRVDFTFLGEDDSSEWTLTFVDEDGDDVGYVNLDDEETVEFDGDDEDLDEEADAGEPHEVVIEVDDDEVFLHIDGDEVLDGEDLDSYDECLHLRIIVDDDMVLTGFLVAPAGS